MKQSHLSRTSRWYAIVPLISLLLWACTETEQEAPEPDVLPDVPPSLDAWQLVAEELPQAALSVSGSSADDVWVVGSRGATGPLLANYNGTGWQHFSSPVDVDLWWVHVEHDNAVYIGGGQGTVLELVDGEFVRMNTPGLRRDTVYGVWADGEGSIWAVGGAGNRDGFIWHFDGQLWQNVALPTDVPETESGEPVGMFKVWGDDDGSIWVAGGGGSLLRGSATTPFERISVETTETLFTVHGNGDEVVAVGGNAAGVCVSVNGPQDRLLSDATTPLLQGVFVEPGSGVWAAGANARLFQSANSAERLTPVEHDLDLAIESLHAVWVDPEGNVWAVGGDVLGSSLSRGAVLRRGEPIAELEAATEPPPPDFECPTELVARGADRSVARRWIEQNLAAIRRDIPRPGVHARNLYHLSAAFYDTWRIWQENYPSLLVADPDAAEPESASPEAVDEAISYAAYRVLTHRYGQANGAAQSLTCFDALMRDMGYDPEDDTLSGTTARAIGNRIGQAIVAATADDGANEASDYQPDSPYVAVNPSLRVELPGAAPIDPERWQPLNLAVAVTQNGIPSEAGDQRYIGPHWGSVEPFAIERPAPDAAYFDAGPPLTLGAEMDAWVVDLLTRSAQLDAFDGAMVDVSPAGYGNNSLGADDGEGYAINPVTGVPYEEQLVPRGDFGRVLAEYWADGPQSETPPGHWNVVAHQVVDDPDFEQRWMGTGTELSDLQWDVLMYLTLNGALHDAAVAAWEAKRTYETSRPITLVRYMGGLGQSTDPELPSYHVDGLPLVEGVIELITEASSAAGQRHEHLAAHLGEVAVYSWPGEPGDPSTEISQIQWIRAVEWMPYQRATFVSPAFPGFVSGHSTFSRAAAEVLTGITGSPWFPGGMGEFVAQQDEYLHFERGPSVDVRLQWARYYDAADQAGQSRIWGGIHIQPDDFVGRSIGSEVGLDALTFVEELLPAP